MWAPEVVTPLQGLRAGLPDNRSAYHDGSDPRRRGALAAASDLAIVVVGYTKLDEGEFIGGTDSHVALRHLLPGPDDPELAESFTMPRCAPIPGRNAPPGVNPEGPLSFATGGDRSSLRLHEADEQLL